VYTERRLQFKIDGFQRTCFWRPILLLTVLLLLSRRCRPEQIPSFRNSTASSSGDSDFKYRLSRLKICIGFLCTYRKMLLYVLYCSVNSTTLMNVTVHHRSHRITCCDCVLNHLPSVPNLTSYSPNTEFSTNFSHIPTSVLADKQGLVFI
jgi:hypothetical protein